MENLTLALGRGSGLALFPHLQKMNKQTKKCYVSNAFQAIQGIFPFLKNMFKIKMPVGYQLCVQASQFQQGEDPKILAIVKFHEQSPVDTSTSKPSPAITHLDSGVSQVSSADQFTFQ